MTNSYHVHSPSLDGTDGAWAKLERQSSTSDPDYKEPKSAKKATKSSSPRKAAQHAQELIQGSSMQMRARTGAFSANFVSLPHRQISYLKMISSVESQKGVIAVQRCSVENQKGTIAVQSLWR